MVDPRTLLFPPHHTGTVSSCRSTSDKRGYRGVVRHYCGEGYAEPWRKILRHLRDRSRKLTPDLNVERSRCYQSQTSEFFGTLCNKHETLGTQATFPSESDRTTSSFLVHLLLTPIHRLWSFGGLCPDGFVSDTWCLLSLSGRLWCTLWVATSRV